MTIVFSLQYGIQEPPRCPAGAFAETPLPSYLRNPSRSSSSRRALARYGPDGHGDAAPGVAPRGALRQVQHDPAHRPLDPHG